MAKATKGSAAPRAAAEDLSARGHPTATVRPAPEEPVASPSANPVATASSNTIRARSSTGSESEVRESTTSSRRDAVIDATIAGEARPLPPIRKKTHQRRRRAVPFVFLALAIAIVMVGQLVGKDDDRSSQVTMAPAGSTPQQPNAGVGGPAATTGARGPARAAGGRAPDDMADTLPAKAAAGTARGFTFVSGFGPVLGTAGTLRRFKVAVDKTIGQGNGVDFADEVDGILGDARSWIAGRRLRLQRVPQSAASEFTIYLAAAAVSERMCAQGGLKTDGFTSCRLPGQVIINLDRWQNAVPDYRAPLSTYRAYAINHEVGHQLGHGHEACPGAGRPAPVMMQQTYGLKGCVANAWPYLGGKRYAGASTA